jgi:O-antigen biosynthesis protein
MTTMPIDQSTSDSLTKPRPVVSIIIPTRNQLALLSTCVSSVTEKTTYAPFEIMIVNNQTDNAKALQYLDLLAAREEVNVLNYTPSFNYSAINNWAARQAKGNILVFMNNDVEIISAEWLEELVALVSIPQHGAVGAMLYYPDDRIQHAGIGVGKKGIASHEFKGRPRGYTDPKGYLKQRQHVAAVTAACMAIRRDLFIELGGFDEVHLPINFNDVDLCLRLLEKGYRNVWTPFAELYHHESATRRPEHHFFKSRRFRGEIDYMMSRWNHILKEPPTSEPVPQLSLLLDRQAK